MESNNNQDLENQQREENELNLGDIIQIVKANWFWFMLSAVICCAIAFLYLECASKIYTRTATVLIKDDSKGGGAMSEAAAFQDLGVMNIKNNVDNVVLQFQAKDLMQNVVKRLKLDMSYTIKSGMRTVELYRQAPVHVEFPDAEPNQTFELKVKPIDKKHVIVFGFKGEGINDSKIWRVPLNVAVKTPMGRMV